MYQAAVDTKTRAQSWPVAEVNKQTASVFVIIPTYNESENLPLMVNDLFKLPLGNLQVVVVDDNSPDGTGQVAERLRDEFNGRVHVIHRPGKQGLGPAYRQGFCFALEQGAEYIIQMDADFSHSPNYIPGLLDYMSHCDVAVGSRYTQGGRLDPRWSIWRVWLSVWANSIYVRAILGLGVKDATGGFKCWSRQALSEVLKYPIDSSGFIFQVEMALLTERLGYKVCEMPIYFADRHAGNSKMDTKIKLEAALRTWELWWKYRNLKKKK